MLEILASLVFLQINLYRMEQGLSYVPESSVVCEIAKKRVDEISTEFKHKFHGEDFKDTDMRIYENLGRKEGENFLENSQVILEMWKLSKTHNENLLKDLDVMCVRTNGKYYTFEGIKWKEEINSP